MHPRNPYGVPIDFTALGSAYPPLAPYIIPSGGSPRIDFQSDAAQRKLTEALLFRDFQLIVQLPVNRLCPPVPNRLNYILWLEDILDVTAIALDIQDSPVEAVDIGTGASAIYPLLSCRRNARWRFFATELDDISFRSARTNIQINGLEDRVSVLKANANGPIFLPLMHHDLHDRVFDFTMCNPPFYESRDEILRSAESKTSGPNAVCTGADVEMITAGGEAAFVCKMVHESLQIGIRCRWYTSMLGKLSSLTQVVETLGQLNIDNYAITEFTQGQTRRWAIAWSFTGIRLPESIARIPTVALQSIMPAGNTLQTSFSYSGSEHVLPEILLRTVTSIGGVSLKPTRSRLSSEAFADFLISAPLNTWSRAARRKRHAQSEATDTLMQIEEKPQLMCRVRCSTSSKDANEITFITDWICGDKRGLFDSFTNHLWRKLGVVFNSQ